MMINGDSHAFQLRDEEEEYMMDNVKEKILELQNVIKSLVNKGDIIEFEITEDIVKDKEIAGKYKIIVLDKTDKKLDLGINELDMDDEDIIPFSKLSPVLDLNLIKALLIGIRTSEIVWAVNDMNQKLWRKYRDVVDFYF